MTLPVRVRPIRILCAEDDPDDRDLVRDALGECRFAKELRFVRDGEELLQDLAGGNRGDPAKPRPDIIFLDLWMPRMDGREALRAIKSDPTLRSIPVIVITTSRAEDDVSRSYELGASSFVRKSATFDAFVEVMATVGKYWFEVVDLPRAGEPATTPLPVGGRTLRILVLENLSVSCPSMLVLPTGSAVVVKARNSADALAHVARDPSIEAVVIDIASPDGREALIGIRAQRPALPILALSSDVFDAAEGLLAGATSFLEKPCRPSDLERALAKIL